MIELDVDIAKSAVEYAAEQGSFFSARVWPRSDPATHKAIRGELSRQQDQIELIASENIVSKAVLEAQGSVLTNKYAEGLPGSALLWRLRVCG